MKMSRSSHRWTKYLQYCDPCQCCEQQQMQSDKIWSSAIDTNSESRFQIHYYYHVHPEKTNQYSDQYHHSIQFLLPCIEVVTIQEYCFCNFNRIWADVNYALATVIIMIIEYAFWSIIGIIVLEHEAIKFIFGDSAIQLLFTVSLHILCEMHGDFFLVHALVICLSVIFLVFLFVCFYSDIADYLILNLFSIAFIWNLCSSNLFGLQYSNIWHVPYPNNINLLQSNIRMIAYIFSVFITQMQKDKQLDPIATQYFL